MADNQHSDIQVQAQDSVSISITPEALAHISNQLSATQARYLRLGVKESGCNGYMYMLDYLEQMGENDDCFSFDDDVQVCVSQEDKPMVAGTEIDMITQGLNSALVFKNPKATSYCGCGESFAVGGEPPPSSDLDPGQLGTEIG
ncbi:MAG: iron-sulfur cluster assembly accessory protein [Pseudomonadota bacterium]